MAFAGMFLVSLAFQVRQLQDGLTWFRGPESSKDVAPIYSFYADTLWAAWSMLDTRRNGPLLFCLFVRAAHVQRYCSVLNSYRNLLDVMMMRFLKGEFLHGKSFQAQDPGGGR